MGLFRVGSGTWGPTENYRTPLRSWALYPIALPSPAGSASPAVANAGQARPEPRHEVPPCPTGNSFSPLLPAQAGTRAHPLGGQEGPGLQDSLAAAGLARAPRGGQGSPADRVLCVCRVALARWEELLSQPLILEKILRELSSNLQQQQSRSTFASHTVEACIQLLMVSNQTSPCSCSGLGLPPQKHRHSPLLCHLPPNSHLLWDTGTQPVRASPAPGSPVPATQGHATPLGCRCTKSLSAQAVLCLHGQSWHRQACGVWRVSPSTGSLSPVPLP